MYMKDPVYVTCVFYGMVSGAFIIIVLVGSNDTQRKAHHIMLRDTDSVPRGTVTLETCLPAP